MTDKLAARKKKESDAIRDIPGLSSGVSRDREVPDDVLFRELGNKIKVVKPNGD
jgi:hypothetical protein